MKKRYTIVTWAGMILILATGLIHALDAPDSFHDAMYKGWLFYFNGIGSLVAAYGIFRGYLKGWDLGFFIAGASLVLYVCSRTVGLPHIPAEPDEWLEPLGVASLIAEGSFVLIYLFFRKILKEMS